MLLLAAVALTVTWAVRMTNYGAPAWWSVILLGTAALAGWAVASGWRSAGALVLAQAVAVGVTDRLVRTIELGSDAQTAAAEAVRVLLDGANPYAHYFTTVSAESASVKSVFPYLPGYMLYYGLAEFFTGTVNGADRWTSIGIVILLAALYPLVGFGRAALASAIFGTWLFAGYLSLDGSNDSTLTFFLLLGIVLLAWAHRDGGWQRGLVIASALSCTWAILFKQFSWVVIPFILLWLFRSGGPWKLWGGIQVVLFAVVTIPFLVTAPGPFLTNVLILDGHANIWGLNVWAMIQRYTDPGFLPSVRVLHLVQLVIVLVAALLLARKAGPWSLGEAIFRGAAILFLLLYLNTWTTAPYYISLVAIVLAGAALLPAFDRANPDSTPAPVVPGSPKVVPAPPGRRFRRVA